MKRLLSSRATDLVELMDDPDCSLEKLRNTYRQFRLVNALFSRWRFAYRRFLRPELRDRARVYNLLDVGCGGGDIPVALSRWAARDGFRLEILAVDRDVRAIEYAQSRYQGAGVDFRRANAVDLVREGARFDFVVSNNLLHHLQPHEIAGLVKDSEALCDGVILFSDVERSRLGYTLFPVVTAPFFHHSFVVPDGLTSIRRSFRKGELAALVPPSWQVRRTFPCRLLLWRPRPA